MSRTTVKSTEEPSKDHVIIIDRGRMSGIAWSGEVSAAKMIEAGFTTQDRIDDAVLHINEYYVPLGKHARTRCVDGRHDPDVHEDNLGAQVPGGAPGAAFAKRLALGIDNARSTFYTDAEEMINDFLRLGLNPGGHRDVYSIGSDKAGCGAIDGLETTLEMITNPALLLDHKRIVRDIYGAKDFDRDDVDEYLRSIGAANFLKGRSEEYFSGREKIISTLEERVPGSIATLEGDHKECLVIVNFVEGTTFSSNRFANDHGGMQAFGYDIWRSKQIAGKLFPHPSQKVEREKFVMARVITSIGVFMALTDGSQRFLLRMPA